MHFLVAVMRLRVAMCLGLATRLVVGMPGMVAMPLVVALHLAVVAALEAKQLLGAVRLG